MDIEVNVMPLCDKCDKNAIASGDGQPPLCPRHATIFLTAPRILKDERALEHDEPDAMPRGIEREPATELPDSVAVIAERILTRLGTLEGLIEGMGSPVMGARPN
jgi:hypothetical protein